jgi:hypothetical protein
LCGSRKELAVLADDVEGVGGRACQRDLVPTAPQDGRDTAKDGDALRSLDGVLNELLAVSLARAAHGERVVHRRVLQCEVLDDPLVEHLGWIGRLRVSLVPEQRLHLLHLLFGEL